MLHCCDAALFLAAGAYMVAWGGVACITILKTPRGHQLLSNLVRSSFEITGITKILKSTKKYYWYGNWSRRLYFVIDKSLGGDKAV